MKINGSVALVTGANRGLGRAFAKELVSRGAAKVYGAARDPAAVTEPGVLPVALDITDPEQVAQVAEAVRGRQPAGEQRGGAEIQHVHRRAGPGRGPAGDGDQLLRHAAHVPGVRARARGGGGGAIVNMLSVTSFFTNPFDASYGASKAAEWSLTNGVRLELHHQGTLVVAVHASFIDTDMAALTDAPKISPESVARQVFDAVEAGRSRCWPTSGPGSSRPPCPATTS